MIRKILKVRGWDPAALARLPALLRRLGVFARLQSGDATLDPSDPAALALFAPDPGARLTLTVTGENEASAAASIVALLRQALGPTDYAERLFSLCRELELVPSEQVEQDWVRVRRRLSAPEAERLKERVRRFESGAGRIRLSDRLDLLLLLLYVKGRFGQVAEGIVGTTRILKLLFLAGRELGTDALFARPYRFQPYRFGPFAAEVYDDVAMLNQAGLVRTEQLDADGEPVIQRDESIDEGLAGNGLLTRYRLSRRGQAFARALLLSARARRPALEPGLSLLKAQFGSLPLTDLLRYVYTRYPEYTTESEILEKTLGL